MTRYRMEDGTVVDTDLAQQSWGEATRWDGNNHISVATSSQWEHQQLYRSRKGRYYLVWWSQWQGSAPDAEWVSEHEAASWLAAMGHDIPADLVAAAEEVTE
jgi:hypothetical protein